MEYFYLAKFTEASIGARYLRDFAGKILTVVTEVIQSKPKRSSLCMQFGFPATPVVIVSLENR